MPRGCWFVACRLLGGVRGRESWGWGIGSLGLESRLASHHQPCCRLERGLSSMYMYLRHYRTQRIYTSLRCRPETKTKPPGWCQRLVFVACASSRGHPPSRSPSSKPVLPLSPNSSRNRPPNPLPTPKPSKNECCEGGGKKGTWYQEQETVSK